MPVNVFISDVRFSNEDILKTTLGSCVSVILFADFKKSKNTLSSMSHFLLPQPSDGNDISKQPFRFGSILIQHQIEEMQRQGLPIRNLRAKLAGGANMFPSRPNGVITDIGKANIDIARQILKKYGIFTIAESVGGIAGRNIEFNPINQQLKVTIFGQDSITI